MQRVTKAEAVHVSESVLSKLEKSTHREGLVAHSIN
jgi:hypothetical protein